MKYTFTLVEEATAGKGNAPEREKRVLESRTGESDRHIALKILAYLVFRAEAAPLPLRIEPTVGQRHRPDLVATEPDTGRVLLWIDCGQIETKRLGRIALSNPQARIVVVKPTENEARLYARAALRFLPEDEGRRRALRFLGFEEGFLPRFLGALRGANTVSWRGGAGAGGEGAFTLNGETFATALRPFDAAEIAAENLPKKGA